MAAKLLRVIRKHWLAILLISPICLCVTTTVYLLLYSKLGRISDFRSFPDTIHFPHTNYAMNVTRQLDKFGLTTFEINLQNIKNQNELQISLGNFGGNPEFSTFESNDKSYLIIKTASLGNDGAMKFRIYDLSGEKIISVGTTSSSEPTIYSSCIYPRLHQNELFFEDAFDCDIYPLFVEEQFFSSIKLSP